MSSKPKSNGRSSFNRIEEAARLGGCTEVAFFYRAADIAGEKGVAVDHAWANYQKFKSGGFSADHGYALPEWLLHFAEKVHDQRCPRNFYRESWKLIPERFPAVVRA